MKRMGLLRAVLVVLAMALAIGVPSGADLPAAVNALWVAESAGALKISTADGQILLEIADAPGARAVAVDPWRSAVWLYSGQSLLAYGFDGARRLTAPVDLPASSRADLAVAPGDGSVWLAVGRELRSVSASGQTLVSLRLADPVETLAVDPSEPLLWIGTSRTAAAYDPATGDLVRTVDAGGPDLRDLDVDPESGDVWVARKDRLRLYGADGTLKLDKPFPGLLRVAADSAGGAWIATAKDLARVSASGQILSSIQPFGGAGTIAELVTDPSDASAWVAAGTAVAQVDASGGLVRAVSVQPPVHIWDLAVYADVVPPEIEILAPEAGAVLDTGSPEIRVAWSDVGSGVDPSTLAFLLDGAPLAVSCAPADGGAACVPASPLPDGDHVLAASISDRAGNPSAPAQVTFSIDTAPDTELPPDPATVAPAFDPTVAPDLAAATEFLYTGDRPIQTGAEPGAIDPRRVAVLRGRVLDREGAPLPGARVTALGHPELGSTLSRADGLFDLAVNGGGPVTLQYEKDGYLTAQRRVEAPRRDYAWADDVALVPFDPAVTAVASGAPVLQTARGSRSEDEDGARTATLLFPAGTEASMVLPDGSIQPLASFNVRATEYTVGPNGPAAMPGPLPTTTAYTYAVELSVDEAVAAGAKEVRFSQPVLSYVENFLGFPVGEAVPAGYYDRTLGAWVPSDNGRVIAVLSVTGGLAELDLDGSGAPADPLALEALGITDGERRQLAVLYQPGQSLWRVPVSHFTPWDYNWPYAPPLDAEPPKQPEPEPDDERDENSDCQGGSIIDCQNQALGETIPLTGTSLALHYQSERTEGRVAALRLPVSLSGDEVPRSLKEIRLRIYGAGRSFEWTYPPAPNQKHLFIWDRKDSYGRTVQGKIDLTVVIDYVYPGLLMSAGDRERSFARLSGVALQDIRSREEILISQGFVIPIGPLGVWNAAQAGLGGWTLDRHHFFDPESRIFYGGDGTTRTSESSVYGRTIFTSLHLPADEGARCVTPDEQGNLYICSGQHILKVTPGGTVTRVAGGQFGGFSGDGGPATEAKLSVPLDVEVDRQGNLYIADQFNSRIRKVDPQGIITTVAGYGGRGYVSAVDDNKPGIFVPVAEPSDLQLDAEGNLYIAASRDHQILRLGVDGNMTAVAGNGATFDIPGNLAIHKSIRSPRSIAIDPFGNLLIADSARRRVFRVGPDGRATLLATDFGSGLRGPSQVAADRKGNVFVFDFGRIYKILPNQLLAAVAGTNFPTATSSGDGGPAAAAGLGSLSKLVVDPEGDLLLVNGEPRVRKISSLLPGYSSDGEILLSSADGREVYVFNPQGRHLRTVNSMTGQALLTFRYDAHDLLAAIEDANGNVTSIQRDAAGAPTAIVAPFGQRTELALDANGYLARITDPEQQTIRLTTEPNGLLRSMTDARQKTWNFTYDAQGFLTRDQDPAGGFKSLDRTSTQTGPRVTLSTGEGRTWDYSTVKSASGERTKTVTLPSGLSRTNRIGVDGSVIQTASDGTVTTVAAGPDPRFGMQAPVTSAYQIRTPSGLVSTWSLSRSVTLRRPDDPLSLASQTETLDANGKVFTRSFDAATRTFTFLSPEGRKTETVLDGQGRTVAVRIDGLTPRSLQYDSRGRLASVVQGAGEDQRLTALSYHPEGFLASITDPLLRSTGFTYDQAGRVRSQTLPDSRSIGFGYDENGNVTSVTPPGRPSYGFGYTAVGRKGTDSTPDAGPQPDLTSYTYNLDRQLTLLARPDGRAVQADYDDAGRRSRITFSRGSLTYDYDPATGKLAGLTAPGGEALGYGYDGFLRSSVTWTGTVSGTVSWAYDRDFRPVETRVNGADPVDARYDRDGLLTGAGPLSLSRDPRNGLLLGTTLGSLVTAQGYNGFGELASLAASFGGAPLHAVTYTRDKLGRISQKVETIGGVTDTWRYLYDPSGRLTDVEKNGTNVSHSEYDANGNRTLIRTPSGTVAATYDAQDRLLTYGDRTYTYTANGELATETQNGHTVTYDYDELGNLRQVELPDGIVIDYVIDGQNRRVGKKVNGVLGQGFLYQTQLAPIAELDGSGNVVSRFVYASRPNVPDFLIKGGQVYRIVSDHLGSPRLVVNTADGSIAQRMDYDEHGKVILDTNPGFQPFGFAGGLYDRQTGLVRFGARDYDPEVGRWTARDPIGFAGKSANLYLYSFGDPVNYIDPNGLSFTAALPLAGGFALADGPLPVGDAIAGGILIAAGLYELWNYFENPPAPPLVEPYYMGPRDKPVSPGRTCPPPTAIPGARPRTTPAPPLTPADPEDNREPEEDDLWKNKERKDMLDKLADKVEEIADLLGDLF